MCPGCLFSSTRFKNDIPCENFFQDLAEIWTRSRHDLGENRGEISTISAPRRDHGQDRGVILRRDMGNPGGQKRAPILCEIREISAAKNAPRSRGDIATRYGNPGGQFRGEVSVGVFPGFAARNEIPGGQNLAVIPSGSEIPGSQNRFDENIIYIYLNN